MELYIFNQSDRKMAGIIEAYEYLRWTRRYSQCGSFEIKAIATAENIALLQIGNILWKNDDEEAGLIEFIELTMQEQEFIVASGRFATSFLARRIVLGTYNLTGDLGSALASLIINSVIAPGINDRKISGINYDIPTLGVAVNTQISYKNVMTAVTDLCEAADVGIKTVFNPATGVFNIVPYFAAYFGNLVSNGILYATVDNLKVIAATNMNVSVQPGSAWINGYNYENTTPLDLPIATANGVNPRIDRVVIRWSNVDRIVQLAVKTGVAASAPAAPDITRNDDIYELGIADIVVGKGVVSISNDNISDTRLNTTLCGLVNSLVSAVYE